jgi:hypothetical protein
LEFLTDSLNVSEYIAFSFCLLEDILHYFLQYSVKGREIDNEDLRAVRILFYAGVTTLYFLSLITHHSTGNRVAGLDFCRLVWVLSESAVYKFGLKLHIHYKCVSK